MRPGDYMVHVFVEKLKDINVPEGSDTVDPMIVVECLGMKDMVTKAHQMCWSTCSKIS